MVRAKARSFPARYKSSYEQEFAAILAFRQRSGELIWWEYEPLTFRLGERCSFTPDFAAIDKNGRIFIFEVKGWAREDAMAKLKSAASKFWWLHFILVRRANGSKRDSFEEIPIGP